MFYLMRFLKIGTTIAVITLLIVTVSGCTSSTSPMPCPTPSLSPSPLSATITSPSSNSQISQAVTVQGTAQGIPSGQSLWIMVVPHSVGRYYPVEGPVQIQPDGTWSQHVYVGSSNPKDIGQKFDIKLTLANNNADSAFKDYINQGKEAQSFPGMPSLPTGASIQETITVIRAS